MKKLLALLICVILLGSAQSVTTHVQSITEANGNMQYVSTGQRFTMVI